MIHQNLKELLKSHNLTGVEFARRMNITTAKASRWVTGTSEPSVADMLKICDMFNVPIDYLLVGKHGNQSLTSEDLKFLSLSLHQKKKLLKLGNLLLFDK